MVKKIITAICGIVLATTAHARDFSKVAVKAEQVKGNIYVLTGSGGNIGLMVSEEGLVMIDDQFRPLAEKIEKAMKSIVDADLKYIINTHYHGDHVGGNSYFGHHAPIFAHENVRNRLAANEKTEKAALPVVTYQDGVKIHIADEEIKLMHLPKGHTDGDTVVYFTKANVVHMGDLFFQGRFPYVDLKGGGSVKGYLANIEKVIDTLPADVVIIPGHGVVTDISELKETAAMMKYSIARVLPQIAAGATEEEVVANGIGEQYKKWHWRFITEERWLKTLYADLK